MKKFVVVLCLILASNFISIGEMFCNLGKKIYGRRKN